MLVKSNSAIDPYVTCWSFWQDVLKANEKEAAKKVKFYKAFHCRTPIK